jgi:hypothetical protein
MDTRPRYLYRLPDGRTIRVIHDHGQWPEFEISYSLGNGSIVTATLVSVDPVSQEDKHV